MPISVPFTGGCACGAIRYECSAEPVMSFNCHCRDCQRASGSAFAANVYVPAPAFTFTKGEPQYYSVPGLNGNMHRGFCSACGSPIAVKGDAFPDLMGVSGASLDDPSGLEPTANTWMSGAQPWDYLNPDIPRYEHQPTEEEFHALLASRD